MNQNQFDQNGNNNNGYYNNNGYQNGYPNPYGGGYYNQATPQQQVYFNPNFNRPPVISEEMRRQIELNNKKRSEKSALIKDGVLFGATIIATLLIQVILVLALGKTQYYSLFDSSCIFQNSFNVLAVHIASMLIPYSILALILKKRFVSPLIPAKKIKAVKTCAWVSFGMGLCIGANYVTNGVIELFKAWGYKLTQTEYEKPDSALAVLVVLVATAIVPAIIEEFAFRCSVMGILRGRGKFFAVLASSIIFGLMHGNVIQFVFALLVGLVLGYITLATDSVIPAMLVHGFNNGLSVISDACTYFFSSKAADYVTGAIMIIWIILAVWGTVYLLMKKELIVKNDEGGEKTALSFGAKLLCLLPGLALPLIILIVLTAQTVVPIK